jgi:hypothetical protein
MMFIAFTIAPVVKLIAIIEAWMDANNINANKSTSF